ncbi:MoxR-like ATPase [Clostridium amylolyticum]|uniref:MoxR-like ATPase n=1 Tax=Clostridium amylolyticum TaxID=1121298 RepID=A0A1M6GZS0_9CLOT|nr:MoxR family ATPase [Clostridium amylolyticum]SHJ15400.1 MoxR-like ATPase [Clostridium amylolyticum]
MELNKFVEFREKVQGNVGKVIIGKEDKIDKIIAAFICGGHVLLEDVPGLGKTKLAKSLAKSLNLSFKRVQFTPDLLPSDLTGIYFYNQKNGEFEFRQGPILSNILLADEINRATPRTQSALLECMEERQVTVEGNTVKLPMPFFVIATQNPVEQFGTFPLPEAQLDRFFIKISLGYPEYKEEKDILDRFMKEDPLVNLEEVLKEEDIHYVMNNVVQVEVKDKIKNYILDIVRATRNNELIEMGASPRASLSLMKGAQALAAIKGRDYVLPEDIKSMAVEVLSHRIILKNQSYGSDNFSAPKIIEDILTKVNVPLESMDSTY